jgi:tRNA(Ile2) C34 agmatinyltransferase TiaS
MTAALLDRPTSAATAQRPARTRTGVDEPTLEGIVVRAWEGLTAHRGVGCPVCGGHMAPRYGASGSKPVGGRCTDCGTTLG